MQGATNFAVVSTGATAVTLVLFREDDLAAGRATHEIPLDPGPNRTGNVWHIALPALDDALLYGEQKAAPLEARTCTCVNLAEPVVAVARLAIGSRNCERTQQASLCSARAARAPSATHERRRRRLQS